MLAIAGALGQWPYGGDAEAVRAQLQRACGDALGHVPTGRWTLALAVDVTTLTSAQAACVQFGGVVTGAQRFDARIFGIAPAEAGAMDLQQRLLLERAYASLHSSSHRRIVLMGGDAGVFLSIERPDWALAEVALLWLSIAGLIVYCGRFSKLSAWLLLPYIAWVSVAAALNYAIVQLNGPFG